MHILNSTRVWIDRPITIGGVLYPHLYDAALRSSLGVVEVPDPAPPEDYSPETYTREDISDPPYVIYKKKSPEAHDPVDTPTVADLAVSARSKRDALIAATDWMVLRAQETGEPVPAEYAAYRQALRDVPTQKGFPSTIVWPKTPEAD